MACIVKVGNKFENLSGYNTFITDSAPNSFYFRLSKFLDTFTAGKNLFLMEGSEFLKESTELRIEIVDADGGTLYVEPGRGVPDYYEGNSVVLSSHVYSTTPVGPAKITILGELKEYVDDNGVIQPIPLEWRDAYNVKWEKNFYINKNEKNSSPVIFYRKPSVTIDEVESVVQEQIIPTIIQSGSIVGTAENPPLGTDLQTWRAGTLYRFTRSGGDPFKSAMDENTITIPSIGYTGVIKEVLNQNTILVDTPISLNNLIVNSGSIDSPFEYSITFDDFGDRTSYTSAVTASFGQIIVKNLDTFTGNVDKLKIYKKSRSDVGDYKFADEVKIVGGNLLRNELVPGSELDGGFGKLTENNVNNYWSTESIQISGSDTSISFDDSLLFESLKINIPSSSFATESLTVSTNQSFDLEENIDYELNFKTLISGAFQDVIIGETTVVSESYARTYYYKYDETTLRLFEPSYNYRESETIIDSPNSQSIDLTKPLIYDAGKVAFYDTPQNLTGSSFSSIPTGYSHLLSNVVNSTVTFDTNSIDWGVTSRVQTDLNNNANVVSVSSSLAGTSFIINVWLDSGSHQLPFYDESNSVSIHGEMYSSGSDELVALSIQNIDSTAKLYYYNSSTYLDELSSYRESTEYLLENLDVNDYVTPPNWIQSGTGSQVLIPYQSSGYNYINIDCRTKRNIELLNAELIAVNRLDSIDGDVLYGSIYDIDSMNFETGNIEFSHDNTDGSISGILSLQNGQTILTIGADTKTGYVVELDFQQGILVFIGELDFSELEPEQRSYDLYDLFDLSGSSWISTGSTDLYVPRVPPQAGDYLYTNDGYPYITSEFTDRNFLTTEFTSPSSSDDNFTNPLEIPYIFRNNNDIIENVYVEESDQIYVVSSVSSSTDINNTNYIYDQDILYSGFFNTGSYSGSLYVDSSLDVGTNQISLSSYNTNITALNPISSSFGEVNFVLLTDSGSTTLPTNTGSLQFHYEQFKSGSEIRNAVAFRNIKTDAKFYYNNSIISQSVLQSYSGSTNIELNTIDSTDFTSTQLWFLSTGSQVIFDFETGSNSHFLFVDYRTNRNSEPLNADLNEITTISQIGTNDFTTLKAREIFPLSGSQTITGSVISTNYYTSQLPLVAGNYLYDLVDYPFIPSSVVDGTYITDDAEPGVDITIPDTLFEIPYVFDVVDGRVENVLVKRLDYIYTASSVNGTETTSYTEPEVWVTQSLKEPDTIVPKTLTAFITGSYLSGSYNVPFTENILTITADASYKSRNNIQQLFTMPYSGSGKIAFSVRGDGWQISNIDLKASQDIAFSPKIFKLFDEQDRKLPVETFDYRFELYDINNNYIPVDLKASKEFSGGNRVSDETLKILRFDSDRNAFTFSTGSLARPQGQNAKFSFSKTKIFSGSIAFASSAFDMDGNYIEPTSYNGEYPGNLSDITSDTAILTISNFSGSDVNYEVGSITYTASVDEVEQFQTIIRLEDGQPGQPGLSGSNGPGLVMTGIWTGSRDYQFTESDALSRSDAVIYDNIYYLAITGSGPGTESGPIQPPNETFWENLGSGSRFVAAELAIFEESFVQNTLNIGTNNNGATSAANITLAGGTTSPYISIGQSAETNTQGYGVGAGIFVGVDGNDGKYKLSIETDSTESTDHLKWDGDKLDIQGSLMVGESGSGIYLDGPNKKMFLGDGNYASADTPFYVASGSSYFSLGDKLTFDGTVLNISGNITVTNTEDFITPTDTGSMLSGYTQDSFTQSLVNPSEYSFGSVFSLASASAVTGLNLTSDYLGYYDGSTFNSYMDKFGGFYLGGDDGALQWDGSDLVVSGSIHAINGFFSGDVTGATVTGGSISGTSISGSIISGSTVTGGSISGSTITGGSINIGSGNFTVDSSGNVDMDGTISIDGSMNMNTNSSITSGIGGGWSLTPSYIQLGGDVNDFNGIVTVSHIPLKFEGFGRGAEIEFYERINYPSGNDSYLNIESDGAIRLVPDATSTYTSDNHVTTYGDFRATGNITAYYSDDRLKIRLGNITNPLDKINTLNGFHFQLNEEGKSLGLTDDSIQIGVSAQEVQKVLSEVVKPAPIDDKYLTVQYERIVPLLIEGIKELTNKVESLENEILKLKGN